MLTTSTRIRVIYFVAIFLLIRKIGIVHGASENQMTEKCCNQVYLFSQDLIGDAYAPLLGIYSYQGMISDRPYYGKNFTYYDAMVPYHVQYYLEYIDNATYWNEPTGWTISQSLSNNDTMSLQKFIYTGNVNEEFSSCPVGIRMGRIYLRDYNVIQEDPTFLIDCHSNQSPIDCNCTKLEVKSTDISQEMFSLSMGIYHLKNDKLINGYSYYELDHPNVMTSYLYFKKLGTVDDGWAIMFGGGNLNQTTHDAITTQIREPCPQAIRRGLMAVQDDNTGMSNIVLDSTLSVTCVDDLEKDINDDYFEEDEFNVGDDHDGVEFLTENIQEPEVVVDGKAGKEESSVLNQLLPKSEENSVKSQQQQQQRTENIQQLQAHSLTSSIRHQLMPKFVTATIICLVIYVC